MWYAVDNGSIVSLHYAVSVDGVNWTRKGLVLSPTSGGYDSNRIFGSSVIKDNGAYKMWYSANDGEHTRIAYATSYDGINWKKNDVEIDFGNDYDPDGVIASCAILDGQQLKMWFGGINWKGPEVINYATTDIYTKPVASKIQIRFNFDTINGTSNNHRG